MTSPEYALWHLCVVGQTAVTCLRLVPLGPGYVPHYLSRYVHAEWCRTGMRSYCAMSRQRQLSGNVYSKIA